MRRIRLLARWVLVAGIFIAGFYVSRLWHAHSEITVRQLEKLSHLVALRVQVADVLKGSVDRVSGIWIVKGDALISVDLAKAQIMHQDRARRSATIRLPQPYVFHARVDHTRTQTYDVKRGWFSASATEDRLRDEAMQQAQKLIETAAQAEEYQALAREHVCSLIHLFFAELGWSVVIEWMSPATR